MKFFTTLLLFIFCANFSLTAQMKVMDPSSYSEWNTIRSQEISNNGEWVMYQLTPGYGDKTLVVYNVASKESMKFDRVKRSMFSEDSKHVVFSIGAAQDTLTYKKRRKVDKKDMPKDSLIVLNLQTASKNVIPNVETFKLPTKWSGILAYEAEVLVLAQDSSKKDKQEKMFFIMDMATEKVDTIEKVDAYSIAEKGERIVFHRNGQDTSVSVGVYVYNTSDKSTAVVIDQMGQYKNVTLDEKGEQLGFIADLDTTKRRLRPYGVHFWSDGNLKQLLAPGKNLSSSDYFVTENTRPSFSEDGKVLYFGVGEPPIMADSLALDDELVQVEVWTTNDPMLYTMQELRKDAIVKETFQVQYDIKKATFLALESPSRRNVTKSNKGNGPYYLVEDSDPYMIAVTWEGRGANDVYVIDSREVGKEYLIQKKLYADVRFSPGGKYAYWFDNDNLDWYTYDLETKTKTNISAKFPTSIVNELHDSPSKPRSYGNAGWAEGDAFVYIYDRFDVWKLDPKGLAAPMNLTKGRSAAIQTRVIDLDRENDFVHSQSLVYLFDEGTKKSGYGTLDMSSGSKTELVLGDYSYGRRPMKARDADRLVYTRESFEVFPDLLVGDGDLSNSTRISDANPQQSDYRWGTIEIFEWKDYKGKKVEGLLVKPEGFDPLKKYPVIVNFYERSSSGLHRHRAPEPHRSTINYSYYANKGYIIFNPDVAYEIGEPGASAFNSVISGVEALSKNQFIDKSRIGVQGHSWGGYQIAHLLNKTAIFKCAESGAPVVNMVSAYGGIRWGSGMSRMFQYEKTQSRLGKTLWEDRKVYLRNSPIFEVDKMNTPVLILHNDNDGAVPWYQGIEYYMALRRLGKPAWFLNYNGEPHWPLKWENRLDFNMRMEQFFAHYLMDQPMPNWMKNGVGVKDKGINQGFEIDK